MIAWLERLARRARWLVRRDERERIMDEEMRLHIELETAELTRAGLSSDEAARRARITFGGVERHKEDGREARGTRVLEELDQDVRYALRQVRTSPGFAAATLLTLSLGIGLSTAMFSIIDAAFAGPPYERPDGLVFIHQYSPKTCPRCEFTASGNYLGIRDRATSFDGISLHAEWSPVVRGQERSDVLRGSRVSADLFRTFRIRPMLGRVFAPADSAPELANVVVLNETIWRTRFSADSNIIGRTIILDAAPFVVVGVVPSAAAFPVWSEIWKPIVFDATERADHTWTNYRVFGRLRDGVAASSATAELATIAASLVAEFPSEMKGQAIGVQPFVEWVSPKTRLIYIYAVAAALVLIIACTNLAGLLIARLTVRRRELAVRAAMGASADRIARQLVSESILNALLAGVLGVVVAVWALRAIRAITPAAMTETVRDWANLGVDLRALAFALCVGAVTGLAIGVWPAWRFSRPDMLGDLKEATRTATFAAAGSRLRRALVVAQIALTVVLLAGAGLLARSVQRLYGAPRGFHGTNVLTIRVQLPDRLAGGADPELFDRIVGALDALPGVESAAATIALPLSFAYSGNLFDIVGRPTPPDAPRRSSRMQPVTPDYFGVLRIPVVRGRTFAATDGAGAPRVAMVNEAWANKFLPGEDPIGKSLMIGHEPWSIVGVVGDVYYYRSNKAAEPEVYRPMRQWPSRWGHLAVRTRADPIQLAPAVLRLLREQSPDMGVSRVATMDALLSSAMASDRMMLGMMAGFAAIAMLISSIGLYAVIAYAVTQRTREFGVRLALGANVGAIRRMVLGQGVRVAAVGAVIGVAAALVVTRLLRAMLFEVTASDPITYALVLGVITAVAMIAAYLPARRASRVDPMTSLRND